MPRELSYQVVAKDLRQKVADGTYGPGVPLPSEADLAVEYRVSRHTVRRAFQELVGDGLVERTRGRGTFVNPPDSGFVRQLGSIDDLMGLSSDTTMEVLSELELILDVAASARLQSDTHLVGHVALVRAQGATRFCHTDVYLPPDVTKALVDHTSLGVTGVAGNATVIGLIEEVLHRRIIEAHQEVTAELLAPAIAKTLNRASRQVAMRVERLYFDEAARPVELAISRFLPEHYSLRTRLRRTR